MLTIGNAIIGSQESKVCQGTHSSSPIQAMAGQGGMTMVGAAGVAPVSRLPGQENQGGVAVPRPLPPCLVVFAISIAVTSALGDNNDVNLRGDRKTLCAIDVGTGSRLCPPAQTTGGLRTRVPDDRRATPLLL
jgi:hypothetical protein